MSDFAPPGPIRPPGPLRPAGQSDSTGPLLEASGLGFEVSGKRILDGVDFTVRRGEMLGVIGPNGAGKTTLLRLICGLLPPTYGRVLLSGKPLESIGHRERARLVSFMSQDIAQDFGFRVLEVVLMGRYPRLGRFERESGEDVEKARRTLSYVGLSGFEDRPFGGLSGGERQLVLFAKVLAQETELIALDEPSSHLDIKHQDTIFSMAEELASEGKAVVASVHNLNVASHYCRRLLLLDHGKTAAAGSPDEVLLADRLTRVYGVKTLVSRSAATGSIDVSVVPFRVKESGARVHLIGGAGSAVNLTRELYRSGFPLTGGISHARDSDETLWKNLGVRCFSVDAFSRISDRDIEEATPLIKEAEVVVLCPFPVGAGNVGNLRLAARAKKLVIIEPGRGDAARSFFAPEGKELFDALCRFAERMTHEQLMSTLKAHAGTSGDGE